MTKLKTGAAVSPKAAGISRRDSGAASDAPTSALDKTLVVDIADDVFDLQVAQ